MWPATVFKRGNLFCTHSSLLCISSMRSVNSTSRLRSQKPSTSYDTYKARKVLLRLRMGTLRMHRWGGSAPN